MRLRDAPILAAKKKKTHFSPYKVAMRLLELFSGTGSIGRVFAEKGWEVVSLDSDPRTNPTIVADIRDWDPTVFPRGTSMWRGHPHVAHTTA